MDGKVTKRDDGVRTVYVSTDCPKLPILARSLEEVFRILGPNARTMTRAELEEMFYPEPTCP